MMLKCSKLFCNAEMKGHAFCLAYLIPEIPTLKLKTAVAMELAKIQTSAIVNNVLTI